MMTVKAMSFSLMGFRLMDIRGLIAEICHLRYVGSRSRRVD